jgi:hypothetical protein
VKGQTSSYQLMSEMGMLRQTRLLNCEHSCEISRCEILSRLSAYRIEIVPRFRQQLKR